MRSRPSAACEAARPHAPGSLSQRRALAGAHAEVGAGRAVGPSPGWGLDARGAGFRARRREARALSHSSN